MSGGNAVHAVRGDTKRKLLAETGDVDEYEIV